MFSHYSICHSLTGEAVVLDGAADDRGCVDEEDPAVVDGVRLAAVDLDARRRPRRPRAGGQALDVVVALQEEFSHVLLSVSRQQINRISEISSEQTLQDKIS